MDGDLSGLKKIYIIISLKFKLSAGSQSKLNIRMLRDIIMSNWAHCLYPAETLNSDIYKSTYSQS